MNSVTPCQVHRERDSQGGVQSVLIAGIEEVDCMDSLPASTGRASSTKSRKPAAAAPSISSCMPATAASPTPSRFSPVKRRGAGAADPAPLRSGLAVRPPPSRRRQRPRSPMGRRLQEARPPCRRRRQPRPEMDRGLEARAHPRHIRCRPRRRSGRRTPRPGRPEGPADAAAAQRRGLERHPQSAQRGLLFQAASIAAHRKSPCRKRKPNARRTDEQSAAEAHQTARSRRHQITCGRSSAPISSSASAASLGSESFAFSNSRLARARQLACPAAPFRDSA